MGISLTIDLEESFTGSKRTAILDLIAPLLKVLRDKRCRATFFVVGEIVESYADQLRLLSEEGHEIGLHGMTHRFLNSVGPEQFSKELSGGQALLKSVIGRSATGFRAPYFSLTGNTAWAPELIADYGFRYSSSILPAWNPQAGFPSAPRKPFRWPNGLIEFPAPVVGIGKLALPVLGGAYLRLAPQSVVRLAARRVRNQPGAWTYAHPYDFDVEEPFARQPSQSWLTTRLLFLRRSLMLNRITSLVDDWSIPLGELASSDSFVNCLPISDPFCNLPRIK